MRTLPPPRTPGEYAVALVCLGNICRSPMADVILTERIAAAGLDDRVRVASFGTGHWHVGKPMDPRAAQTLRRVGLDPSRHVARQFDPSWLDAYDLVLAMDSTNLADVLAQAPQGTDPVHRIRLFREFDPDEPGSDVPDPYYGGSDGFEEVLAMVQRTADGVVAELSALFRGSPQRATTHGGTAEQ